MTILISHFLHFGALKILNGYYFVLRINQIIYSKQKLDVLFILKGHWTSITSSPNFFKKKKKKKKKRDFYTIRSVGMINDCMQSFTF